MKLSALALSVALSTTPTWSFTASTTTSPAFGIATRQSTTTTTTSLFGILDEVASGAYELGGKGTTDGADANQGKATNVDMNNSFEMFLAELVFSTNNPRIDIANNLEKCTDPEWLTWLDNKIDTSTDPEERSALRDLYAMIEDIVKRMEVSQMAEERKRTEEEKEQAVQQELAAKAAEEGKSLSDTDLLMKAQAIDKKTGLDQTTVDKQEIENKKTFYEQELTPEIRLSYQKMLDDVLPPYENPNTMESTVRDRYDQFDAQFVKLLNEEAMIGNAEAQQVLECLSQEQQARISTATESLKRVLTAGDPMRMEGQILQLAREGKIDEPFLLLLEANADQAKAAGAQGPADLMEKLRKRAMEEKDKQASSKEVRLIRKLLRTSKSEERATIFEDAFTPKEQLIVPGTAENAQKAVDGELPEQEKPLPEVSPPDFINACKAVLLNFGNLGLEREEDDLAARIKLLASEAEVIATRIYGHGMSPKEQQDRAWKDQTTSIFDLETMEIEAEQRGEHAPWSNPEAGDDFIPGFDASGKMQVGGG
mmetsp:Transcript_1387/g.2079  ORF Transcript_1387/g.2079 Transcript_1387/m.2079 type:complete len:539 (+) Transcript_1387:230-1846(+)|eukprot:CAMPEP_0194200204 /NCGR_PEP_ID=MMETSP0156-20130528/910_1 /TAXON_ID=33649 /ORGANISM="Thalassionema nitzschioides, Strain L26-B" /LENGTH=538 /DNA_ID=CAMNT_0038925175 /DNA_START=214 /DNA_END=1830 /DNA_ORIENTATION=-